MSLSWLARQVMDRVIRRKVALHKTPLDRYQVRIARTLDEYRAAFGLVHAAYVSQGIKSVRASELDVSPHQLLPEASVLVAYEGDKLVGTITVILDSSAGLPLDKDYAPELDALRHQGAKIVEYSAFAVVQRCWHTGVSNLLVLAATALASRMLEPTHAVIGVHPRVSNLYRTIFNYRGLGAAKQHATLHAPVTAMVLDLAAAKRFALTHYRTPMSSGRLVAEHFFGAPPPPCTVLPVGMSCEMYAAWKMPREVRQALMRERTNKEQVAC